jgi:cytochrome c oxidase subunit I+III
MNVSGAKQRAAGGSGAGRLLTVCAVDHWRVGRRQLAAALLFFAGAIVLALLLRVQLAVPGNRFLAAPSYAQVFTLHGFAMLFLCALPAAQALGVWLLPRMLGARDLPFPRLAMFSFGLYAGTGLALAAVLVARVAPDAGWIPALPLAGYQNAPGPGPDLWLAAAGLLVVAALCGAVQLVVAVLRTRAPGMRLTQMPMFAWSVLVSAALTLLAFAPLLLAIGLLALERALHWPFFTAEKGGDPLLWQHLFWMSGHPAVLIVLLPVAGLVSSMLVPVLAGRRMGGYRWIVGAFVGATAVSVGAAVVQLLLGGVLENHARDLRGAAGALLTLPATLLLAAWLSTFLRGRAQRGLPLLHLLGALAAFLIGAVGALVVLAAPSRTQDTYFLVAQQHYLLLGGLVLPLVATAYQAAGPEPGNGRLGRWAWLALHGGTHACLLPMFALGLAGMPRRVYTYAPGLGWEAWNQAASGGAVLFAFGAVLTAVDLWLRWRRRTRLEKASLSACARLDITSSLTATPQYDIALPRPTWLPLLGALAGVAAAFLLALRLREVAAAAVALALAALLGSLWRGDESAARDPAQSKTEGPLHDAGTHARLATALALSINVLALVTLMLCYVYLWSSAVGPWPPLEQPLPILDCGALSVMLWVAGGALLAYARACIGERARCALALSAAVLCSGAALAVAAYGLVGSGLQLQSHASAGLTGAALAWQAGQTLAAAVLAVHLAARAWLGRLDLWRRATFDNASVFFHYTVVQGVVVTAFLYLMPRIA